MSHSIYFRHFFIAVLTAIISFALLGGLYTAWIYDRRIRDKEENMSVILQETARFAITQHTANNVALNNPSLSLFLSAISETTGYDILITNAEGVVYACSERDFRFLGRQIQVSTLQELSITSQKMTISSLGQVYYDQRDVMAVPLMATINNESVVLGYLLLTAPVVTFTEVWQGAISTFVYLTIGVLTLTLIVSFFIIKRQAMPINKMASVARGFARGDFSARVDNFGRSDELWQLSQSFNLMADSIERSEVFRRNFVANLSHELKTPMTVINGFAEGLLDGTIAKENHDHYLGVISSEARRLSRLVEKMLDMTMFESPNTHAEMNGSFDISELAKRTLLSLNGKIEEKNLDVIVKFPDEAVITRGDKDSITQVLYNLLENAIKYSPPGGTIRLIFTRRGDRAHVTVENTGVTIPANELPHIFESFYKIDKSRGVDREGVGLGLYIVKTILDKHKENIYVTSAKGLTKFMFTLTIV